MKQTMIVLALLLANLACAQVEAPKAVQEKKVEPKPTSK